MQINTFSNVASMAQAQVSNKKADGNATENTKDTNVQSANSNQDILDKLKTIRVGLKRWLLSSRGLGSPMKKMMDA